MERIKVNCSSRATLPIEKIEEFQGELKSLSKKNYEKCKRSFLKFGIIKPIDVWESSPGVYKCLDGHQRIRTLKEMKKEGYIIPEVPINFIMAENDAQARRILLAQAVQYGEMNKQGLYEYLEEHEIDFSEVEDLYHFPEVNLNLFKYEYYKELFQEANDPHQEWQAMPEFVQNKLGYQRIVVHFRDAEAVQKFAKLVEQQLTDETKFIWFPIESRIVNDTTYVTK